MTDTDMSHVDELMPVSGGRVYVRRDGPRRAPALLLVHGSASSGRVWNEVLPHLTGAFGVIRIDLLGFGRSDKPDADVYGTAEQAARCGEVLDRLGAVRAVVAGHSSGGAVATAIAEGRPDLVAGLNLINTGPAMDAYIGEDPGGIDPSAWPPSDEAVRALARDAFANDDFPVPDAMIEDVRAMTFGSFAATMRASTEYLVERDLPGRLAGLGKPLLVVYGDHDRRWDPASFARYAAVPGADVVRLAGPGHTPILEDPKRTAEVMAGCVRTFVH